MKYKNRAYVFLQGDPNTSYTAILFDVNGVIVDDEHLHQRAFRESFRKMGILMTGQDYRKYFLGKSDSDGILSYCLSYGVNTNYSKLENLKNKIYLSLIKEGLCLYPGVIECLKYLKIANIYLGLVTSSTRSEMQEILQHFRLSDYFSSTISCNDVQAAKPNPAGYLLAAQEIGVPPSECLVIEDSPTGIAAAHNANMSCIAVAQTHEATVLEKLNVNMVIDATWKLKQCLRKKVLSVPMAEKLEA